MSKALTSKSIGQFLLDNAITIVLLLLVAVFVYNDPSFLSLVNLRSEERRVGKECRL